MVSSNKLNQSKSFNINLNERIHLLLKIISSKKLIKKYDDPEKKWPKYVKPIIMILFMKKKHLNLINNILFITLEKL